VHQATYSLSGRNDSFGSKLEGLLALNWAFDYAPYARNLRSLRDDQFKYIRASDGRHELYKVALDPAEESNLIDLDPQAADALDARLDQWLGSFTRPGVDPDQVPVEMDEATRERLEALGYL
jgi:arylsulfatase A-like enzyme